MGAPHKGEQLLEEAAAAYIRGLLRQVRQGDRVMQGGHPQLVRARASRTAAAKCTCGEPKQYPDPYDNVMTLIINGWEYRMYTSDASMRKDYDGAQSYCKGLADGWDLVPCNDNNGYDTVKKLCSANQSTCWLGGKERDKCPLITADGYVLKQGCEEPVLFMCCRKVY